MAKSKHKPASVYEREMRRPSFRAAYDAERDSFSLEVQILNLLEARGMKLADLARATGVPRSNITRDLKEGGIQRATLPRVAEIANAADADFIPVIMPRDPRKRREVIHRLQAAFAG